MLICCQTKIEKIKFKLKENKIKQIMCVSNADCVTRAVYASCIHSMF